MIEENNEWTTVSCRGKTKERLNTFGIKGEQYDEILNKLMNVVAQAQKNTTK